MNEIEKRTFKLIEKKNNPEEVEAEEVEVEVQEGAEEVEVLHVDFKVSI